jgi:hypothetical protein
MNLLSSYAKLLLYNIPEENILAIVISKQKLQTDRQISPQDNHKIQ